MKALILIAFIFGVQASAATVSSEMQIQISGNVDMVMYIKDNMLFSNSPRGCIVSVGDQEILRVRGPVLDYPIDYELKPTENFSFKELP